MTEKEMEKIVSNSDVKKSITYPIYLVSKEAIRKYNELLAEYDITYTQYLVLSYFFKRNSSNLKSVGKALMLDSSTLTPLLKKLEKKGYITRSISASDERNLQVDITEKGLALEPKLKAVFKKIRKMSDMTQEELDQMHKLLFKMLNSIIESNKKEK